MNGSGRSAMVVAGRNIRTLKPSRMAYFTVVLEASELGAAAAKSREEMLKATAKLAFDWAKTKISVDAVRGIVGQKSAYSNNLLI